MPYYPIQLAPALATDLYAISALECLTFYATPFSAVAFGPTRDSPANLALAARDRAKPNRVVKAVLLDANGGEEIVGAAVWTLVVGRRERGHEVLVEASEEEETDERNPGGWGIGANVRFCEEVFGKGDESMLRSCEGNDYAKLSSLVVHPRHQRRGIGTQLLERFLHEADELGLQAVLGASKEGRELYRRYGFVDFEIMELRMWEWEGGEDMQGVIEEHVIMHRPAKVRGA